MLCGFKEQCEEGGERKVMESEGQPGPGDVGSFD